MANVYFDIETRGSLDLTKVGMHKYLSSSNADIILLAYRIGLNGKTRLWTNPEYLPQIEYRHAPLAPSEFIIPKGHTFYAFNINFDRLGVNIFGGKYGMGKIHLQQCIDVQALVARFGFPQALDKAAKVLLKGRGKKPSGKRLIDKITQPPWEFTALEFEEFKRYAMHDVDIMCDVIKALPSDKLSPKEQQIWLDTSRINNAGVPVDLESSKRIYAISIQYIEEETEVISELTDYEVTKVTQTQRIKNWVNAQGGDLPNTKKQTLNNVLDEDYPPDWMTENIREVLELRRLFGSTSITKYKSIIAQCHEGRIYNNLTYHGGHTGRETGKGFQIHNLPRAKVYDPEAEITKFFDLSILTDPDPIYSAKALIRPMIFTTKNKILGVWDYSGIENRLLYWFANDFAALNEIYKGVSEYKTLASQVYKVPEDKLTPEQYTFGKASTLGAGYGLSPNGLWNTCQDWGLKDVTWTEVEEVIRIFRNLHPKVVKSWYRLSKKAKAAVANPGVGYPTDRSRFEMIKDRRKNNWLILTLPSGRNIFYFDPTLEEGQYGLEIRYWGVDSQTKKWVQLQLYHSKIIENIIQSIARDVLMDGRRRITERGYKVIASVHDENIVELDYGPHEESWQEIKDIMETPPEWLTNCKLAVEGYCSRRYKKD